RDGEHIAGYLVGAHEADVEKFARDEVGRNEDGRGNEQGAADKRGLLAKQPDATIQRFHGDGSSRRERRRSGRRRSLRPRPVVLWSRRRSGDTDRLANAVV